MRIHQRHLPDRPTRYVDGNHIHIYNIVYNIYIDSSYETSLSRRPPNFDGRGMTAGVVREGVYLYMCVCMCV